jgi:hypothetical protein
MLTLALARSRADVAGADGVGVGGEGCCLHWRPHPCGFCCSAFPHCTLSTFQPLAAAPTSSPPRLPRHATPRPTPCSGGRSFCPSVSLALSVSPHLSLSLHLPPSSSLSSSPSLSLQPTDKDGEQPRCSLRRPADGSQSGQHSHGGAERQGGYVFFARSPTQPGLSAC